MMYVLSGIVDGHRVSFSLTAGRHRVGRGSWNDIQLANPTVSREHAELVVSGSCIEVRDLSSRNGTWLRDQRITEIAGVNPGERIRFGSVELSVLQESHSESGLTPQTLNLTSPDAIRAQEFLDWSDIQSGLTRAPNIDPGLFRAVTEAGQLLALSHSSRDIFDRLLNLVSRVINARRVFLILVDAPDATPVILASHPSAESGVGRLMLSRTILATVLDERRVLLLNDAQKDTQFRDHKSFIQMDIQSAIVAPLFSNESVIGLLYADNDDPRAQYDANQVGAFTLLANLIATKITNVQLMDAQREKERMQQEVALASRVQLSLLSFASPKIPGYGIHARQIPCYEVAGDLYDFTRLDDGRTAIAIGDVTGKGMGAALLMADVIASLRVLYEHLQSPADLMMRLHKHLLRCSDETHYVTLFLGILDPGSHRLEFVNAGHPPPLMFCGSGEPRRLEATGLPAGLLRDLTTYRSGHVDLPAGCLLCLYSDGISEAGAGDDLYGEQRLIGSLGRHPGLPLDDVADSVLGDLESYLGDRQRDDDVTLLLLRRD